ncbi:MAG: hypothetical protein ABFS56_27960 [Pseudomonadota bacterium]
MQVVEFIAKVQNRQISIPEIYKDWYNNTVRVVLLREPKPLPQETDSTELQRFFDEFNADLTGYRFNREEANERR